MSAGVLEQSDQIAAIVGVVVNRGEIFEFV
jgi:hypothetical protein